MLIYQRVISDSNPIKIPLKKSSFNGISDSMRLEWDCIVNEWDLMGVLGVIEVYWDVLRLHGIYLHVMGCIESVMGEPSSTFDNHQQFGFD